MRLITPSDKLRVEVFLSRRDTHSLVSLWLLQCGGGGEGGVSLHPADSGDVRRQQQSQGEDAVGGEGRWGPNVAEMGKSPLSQPTACQQGAVEAVKVQHAAF